MTASRRPLPQRRSAENFDIEHNGHRAVVTVGRYDDRSIGEVFISGHKVGSELEATARDGAVLISIALQYGVPLEVLRHALTRNEDGTASTLVGAVVDRLADQQIVIP